MAQHPRFRYEAVESADALFTPSFIDYLLALHDQLAPRIATLMARRAEALARALGQGALPAHPPSGPATTGDWKVPPVPDELRRPGIEVVALWSHLSTPDDERVSAGQEARLAEAVRVAGADGIGTHLAASGGLLTGRGIERTLVRPGLVAYGVAPGGQLGDRAEARWLRDEVRPALRLVAHAIRLEEVPAGTTVGYGGTWVASRPSRIATLPVGYGDGYSRAFAGSEVLVRGRRAPVVGVVSMDSCTVDVTSIPGVGADDEFVLLGSQGDDAIPALALAQRRTTIPWEVLSGMARRLTRVYDAPAGPMGVRTLAGETLVP